MKTQWAVLGCLALACMGHAAFAATSDGVKLLTQADLKAVDAALIAQMGDARAANTVVMSAATSNVLVLHREVSGNAELHEKLSDFFIVLSGEGELEIGGTVIGERLIKPNEKQGDKLEGAIRYPVKQGDVLFIPANVWHRTVVSSGKKLSAIVIKVQS